MVEKRPKTFKKSKPPVKKPVVKKKVVKKTILKKTVKKNVESSAPLVIPTVEPIIVPVQTIDEEAASIETKISDEPVDMSSATPSQGEEITSDTHDSPENIEESQTHNEKEPDMPPATSSVPPFTPHFDGDEKNEPLPKKRRVLLILSIFIVLLILIISVIFVYFYVSKKSSIPFLNNDVVHVKHVEVSPKVATPTPTKIVDRTAYDIEILNGSGKAGEASKAKTLLTGENFIVSDVGNADKYTYKETLIAAKKTVDKGFLDALKQTLTKDYTVATDSSVLESSSTSDVVVTVGSE